MPFGGPTLVGPTEPCIRWGLGSSILRRKRATLSGCLARWKSLGVSAAVYAAKGIIQSSVAVRHAMRPFCQNSSTTCYYGYCVHWPLQWYGAEWPSRVGTLLVCTVPAIKEVDVVCYNGSSVDGRVSGPSSRMCWFCSVLCVGVVVDICCRRNVSPPMSLSLPTHVVVSAPAAAFPWSVQSDLLVPREAMVAQPVLV